MKIFYKTTGMTKRKLLPLVGKFDLGFFTKDMQTLIEITKKYGIPFDIIIQVRDNKHME